MSFFLKHIVLRRMMGVSLSNLLMPAKREITHAILRHQVGMGNTQASLARVLKEQHKKDREPVYNSNWLSSITNCDTCNKNQGNAYNIFFLLVDGVYYCSCLISFELKLIPGMVFCYLMFIRLRAGHSRSLQKMASLMYQCHPRRRYSSVQIHYFMTTQCKYDTLSQKVTLLRVVHQKEIRKADKEFIRLPSLS